jgi:hypothetical protein
MDYTKANFFHFRMGPFYGDADHESEWADIGGPYLGNGPEWNPAFWEKVQALVIYAGARKANVEVNVIDTWYCKHAQWGDQQIPWPAADVDACGRRASPEQERYIRKVVSELGQFANVVWLTDNEGGEIQGTTRAWYEWVRDVIRDEEQKTGFGVVHLVGTNNTDFADGPFDYVATHANAPLIAPFAGKHGENNERNGQPQNTPEEEHSRFCTARAKGLHYWFWRAEMTDAQFYRAMELFQAGCGGPQQCFAPQPEDPLWGENVTGAGQMRTAVEQAKAAVGEKCGSVPPHEGAFPTLAAVADELRKAGRCASGPWGDAVAVLAPDGWWEEYHAVAFTDGCWANNAAVLPKFRWRYNGVNPTPSCGSPAPPPLSKWNVKEHTKGPNKTVVDSTPLIGPDAGYCAAIGFTDGRSFCPVRQEGAADRVGCETQVVGRPVWSGPGEQSPENPYQFFVPRGVTGTATVCASAAPSVCGSVEVTP